MKNTQKLNYKAKANAHAKAKAKAKAKANTNAKAKSKSKSKSKRLSLVTHELDPTPDVGAIPHPGRHLGGNLWCGMPPHSDD